MINQHIEHLLFPTLVYQNNIPVNNTELEVVKNMMFERAHSNNGFITKDKTILTLLSETRKSICQHLEFYIYNVLRISKKHKFYITTSWVNKHITGDAAHTHFHANSLISGCYYLQMPKNAGDICFPKPSNHNNFLNNLFNFELNGINEINTSEYKIIIKPGTLLLFPSQIKHYTEINNSSEERYSLAFNVWVKGQIGNDELEKLEL